MAAVVAAGVVVCAATPAQAAPPVWLGVVPDDVTVADLARVRGMSVGVMSTGIGDVPPEQTYLDISQGNRVDDALYDRPLPATPRPFLRVPRWSDIVERADAAPADILPGLLGSTLLDAGVRPEPTSSAGSPAIMVADRSGEIGRVVGGPVGIGVFRAGIGTVHKLARAMPAGGVLIVFAEPLRGRELVPIGIAGNGFEGSLTSDSTRTDGYVLSTDIGPTILERLGLEVPTGMNGEPIRSAGAGNAAAVDDLADRMAAIPDRREPILVVCILAWLLAALAVRVVLGLRRVSMAWLALCFAYMPLTLLAGAWLEPSAIAEGLVVGVGSALLAAATVRLARGWRGLAIACASTLLAYAIDLIAGSDLTSLSLLGPNPIFGARFFGIGNELEALFAVMVPVGVGAALSAYVAWGREMSRSAAAAAFIAAGALGAAVFGAGALGADVGAAIVLPVGAVVAAGTLPADLVHLTSNSGVNRTRSSWRRIPAAAAGAAIIAVVLLAVVDLVSGGDSHLTRSLIDAGGASSLADVAQRRLELSAHDFAQAAGSLLFWVVVAGIALAAVRWRRIDRWLEPTPIARAGVLGACAAVAVGVLVNDSGATFLVLGALALGASLAYAWSQTAESTPQARPRPVPGRQDP